MSNFITLNITTEGPTERAFVNKILSKHLLQFNIFCKSINVLTSRSKNIRGGMTSYAKAKGDISEWLRTDNREHFRFTTMFDFYALPDDFPGLTEAIKINDPYNKVQCIEKAMDADINDSRFKSYIQLHEFEALIFSDLDKLLIDYEYSKEAVVELKKQLSLKDNNPELVNDKKETSPSHRIIKLIPEFQKVNSGSQILNLIGIDRARQQCKHFNDWLTKLEGFSQLD